MLAFHTYTRSHDLCPTRWCDLFDLTSPVGEGWMLLDLPGAPCDVTQTHLRTMSQRLRKAQDCAAAGGKYGLLQAVLLSMDSQLRCPAQWLRMSVGLEACSKVLLPAAHEAQVDLGAARAAYQQLTPAGQRLWRQLQAARIQLRRGTRSEPGSTEGYLTDNSLAANVLAGVTGDPSLLGHEVLRGLMFECRWDLVCRFIKRFRQVDIPSGIISMQAAYNWALAAYFHHGKDHAETKTALAAALAADPEGWVPKLLAGLSYPPLAMAPASVPRSRMEAVGYAFNFGMLWVANSTYPLERMMEMLEAGYASYSAPLKWLLGARGIAVPPANRQREVAALRQLACGDHMAAYRATDKLDTEATLLLAQTPWPACKAEFERLGAARSIRGLVVYLLSTAVATANLPPLGAGVGLWEALGHDMGYKHLSHMGIQLRVASQVLAPEAVLLITYYQNPLPPTAAAATGVGFTSVDELEELGMLSPLLCVAAGRWAWQCGDAAVAYQDCNVQSPEAGLYVMRLKLSSDSQYRVPPNHLKWLSADGLLPPSVQAIDDLAQFVVQEKGRQRPGTGLELIDRAYSLSERQGAAAGKAIIRATVDRAEQQLYEQFPVWLDQLVSQVTGRSVTLVIEPKAAHSITYPSQLPCSMYLKHAGSGGKQVFGWRRPGDVNWMVSIDVFIAQAMARGVTDPDLLKYCSAVEPLAGALPDNDSSNSSSRQRPTQEQVTPAAAAGGKSAATSTAAGGRGGSAAAAAQAAASPSSSGSSSSSVKPSRPCAQCGELFPKLKLCTRCRSVSYCSKQCQLEHWRAGHKLDCKEQP